jgi:hypothetical protein
MVYAMAKLDEKEIDPYDIDTAIMVKDAMMHNMYGGKKRY